MILELICEFAVCTNAVVDGEDLSNYDATDEHQQQKDDDYDTLDELQRELTSHSLGLHSLSTALSLQIVTAAHR